MACHPPPPPGGIDPYQTLGLTHNATPTQIKVAYRKLALRYHPDRQQQSPTTVPTGSQQSSSAADAAVAAAFVRCAKEATDRFSEIAAAYAKLSDPARKKEYDHLYKFGAFDDLDNDQNNSDGHNAGTGTTGASNYQYTENYSGGYYREGYVPPTAATSFFQQQQQQRAAAAAFQTMQSQDSFFDDLIYSPKSKNQSSNTFASTNKNTTNNSDTNIPSADENDTATESQRAKQPGIGFSFTPAGKHLSVHVPSRNEIMTNMTRGDMPRGAHLFGTRVTFSQQTSSGLGKLERIANCSADTTTCGGGGGGGCNGSSNKPLKEKKVVSTTTRIAKGQKRIVRRTAHLRPDGTKEVVIEENGVVRRRYIEESANTPNSDNDVRDDDETSPKEKEGEEEEGGLQKENKFTLMGLFKTCLAPCSSIAG
mmetsp:Transcript_27644/g.50897  ORF Transcript_27644/g.50897 Transcript_27644/m.50897 type:complete len:423 (+) Transcript_27644:300-1568(+)|eukprot:CAMPEP_0201874874 /NCGR_PEP_ID=MMETSP0902-20130614/7003_1 /ASSEMBLY_ACC=CAM_ASM_000551 /TAXON_ID=420261 /ORGANISM="Thalassiosira antarctica, Strain CCMP982" /LENGTH=422 /DNA_ID=CAMNT_0048401817 /DNA_START=162 /DNA_END=1430 /DNA_ORIENTATION=+